MNFKIVTDSSANLTDEVIDRYGIEILSLSYLADGKEYESYVKGTPSDLPGFYRMLRKGATVTTSCANAETSRPLFEEILKAGEDLLYIGFSSALSATYQNISGMLDDLQAQYPDRKVLHVDSLAASGGQGLLVLLAALQQHQGKSVEEVHRYVLDNRLHLCHWFTVDDLMFLKRGGRVSSTAAVFGTILGIKPLLHVDDQGRLIAMNKTIGRKMSIKGLFKKMEETGIDLSDQIIGITHGDCIEDAHFLADMIREKYHPRDIVINYVDTVIGAHSGPGTLALFFLGTHR